ncbi:DUF4253 domain-containing protein [Streptomyces sp. NPDC004327]|uniref:DUF4253 domain-containing protein n=1 Tax=Streptomyces sp. NPDC004327 TaxID=3364699 RepID=UPI0036D0866E
MAMTIDELQQLRTLPPLREAATATDGTPVYAGEVDGVDAFRLWSDLRRLHEHTGWWPVLAGEPDELASVLIGLCPDFAPGTTTPSNPDLLSEEVTADAVHALAAHVEAELDLTQAGGIHVSALGQDRTTLCLVQAPAGHDVPALLNWLGACNYDLNGADHQAVLRHFHTHYGADLVTLEPDIIELLVHRRPATPESLATATLEHLAYCPDIVSQGVGSLEALAAGQLRAGSWYFWWD